MITAYIALAIGSGLLTLFVVLLAWTKVRVVKLKADLLNMRCDFRTAAKKLGATENPHVIELDETISTAISKAGLLTNSELLFRAITSDRSASEEFSFETEKNSEVRRLLRRTLYKLGARFLFYLVFECASGLVLAVAVVLTMGTIRRWSSIQRMHLISRSADAVYSAFGPRMHTA